jgi:signal transduction histidine kinase
MIARAKPRLGLRERIWVTVVGSIAIVVIGLTFAFNTVVSNRLDREANSVAVARASAELDALRVTSHGVELGEAFDAGATDTPTWVFAGTRELEKPRADGATERAAATLTSAARGLHDVTASDTRLYAVPVLTHGRRIGTVVSAVDLGTYERIRKIALIGSCVLALAALIAVTLATRWLLSRALRPVAQMTDQAAEWSERDLGRRFSLGLPRDEFSRLAATLDGLLDRVATSLRHEQNLTAELSHELRTPLTQISAEAQYALRHPADADQSEGYRRILASAGQMTKILDTLISAARAEATTGHSFGDAGAAVAAAIRACEPLARSHSVRIAFGGAPRPVQAGVESALLERMVAPLLENACRYASKNVDVVIAARDSQVDVEVIDDGPGIPADRFESIFTPSYRGADGAAPPRQANGVGLGLPLARRLARGAGGDVRIIRSDVGARFVVTVPRG